MRGRVMGFGGSAYSGTDSRPPKGPLSSNGLPNPSTTRPIHCGPIRGRSGFTPGDDRTSRHDSLDPPQGCQKHPPVRFESHHLDADPPAAPRGRVGDADVAPLAHGGGRPRSLHNETHHLDHASLQTERSGSRDGLTVAGPVGNEGGSIHQSESEVLDRAERRASTTASNCMGIRPSTTPARGVQDATAALDAGLGDEADFSQVIKDRHEILRLRPDKLQVVGVKGDGDIIQLSRGPKGGSDDITDNRGIGSDLAVNHPFGGRDRYGRQVLFIFPNDVIAEAVE